MPWCCEESTYRPCCACERGMTQNKTYAFPDRHTVLCLCNKCWLLGFRLLPDGTLIRELDDDEGLTFRVRRRQGAARSSRNLEKC